jgi:hypothetical protein
MSDAFQERTFVQGRTLEEVTTLVNTPGSCFGLYRVQHRASFLSTDGKLMICWFAAPDAEAVRSALRKMETDSSGVWGGTSHEPPGLTRSDVVAGNVLVERNLATTTQIAAIQAQEQAGAPALAEHQVKLVFSFLARDGKRALIVYSAPDMDSVTAGMRLAKLSFDRVWPIHTVCSMKSSWPTA